MSLPGSVQLVEVAPRDGLQIEAKVLPAAERAELVDALAEAGLREIEVGSFVSSRAVPQMAGTERVLDAIRRRPGVRYTAVWLNEQGLARALGHGGVHVDGKLTLTASESFVRRNTNRGIEDTLAEMPGWIRRYREAGIEADSLGMMAAFGCNFEGEIAVATVVGLVARAEAVMAENGCRLRRLSLADTMGWAGPDGVRRLVGAVRDRWPGIDVKLHLHDTRGAAIANAVAALGMGVARFDASVGGIGGCPFSGPNAAGNVCTEDLAFCCEEMGVATGLDLGRLIEAARLAERLLGHPLPGKLMRAGLPARRPAA